MKNAIHPEYGPSTIRCGCGNSWETRATKSEMRIEVCSECHPFFTGEQRIVDTAGRVERFRRRFGLQEEEGGADAASSDDDTAEDAASAEATETEEATP